MGQVEFEPTTAAGSLLREVYFLSKWTAAMKKEDSPLISPYTPAASCIVLGGSEGERVIEED
jgi:hypothetical protein